ncbi:MAG: DUF4279 domain-containing protein [Pseudomonadota bacterium]
MGKFLTVSAPEFNHSFSSCSRCYATLRIYHPTKSPNEVTETLKMSPTSQQTVGDSNGKRTIRTSGWFLTTRDLVKSRDIRAHIWNLISDVEDKNELLKYLLELGWEMDIFCFWESESGNGGPLLDVSTMSALSCLGLELGFDIWFE